MEHEPNDDYFKPMIDFLPHGVTTLNDSELSWFRRVVNSDVRRYYRLLRSGVHLKHSTPLGRSGMTAGELAIYIIRSNHEKRKKRY